MSKILVVNNDETFIAALKSRLANFGYQCAGITKGSQLFQVLSNFQPDLVVLDVEFDSLPWTDIGKRLRQSSSTKQTKYMLLTREVTPALEHQAKINCVTGIMTKPFHCSDFVAKIRKMLGK